MVIQYNKRDLPNIAPVSELRSALNKYNAPDFEAQASIGKGVFETLRYEKGALRRLPEHLRRFRRGAKRFGLSQAFSEKAVTSIVGKLAEMNHLSRARVRLSIWKKCPLPMPFVWRNPDGRSAVFHI